MRIVWNERSIRWFQNASEYTGYSRKLADILLEYIPNRDTLCDMGCGAGLVDFALAPHIGHITCVDSARAAIDTVEAERRRRGLTNISALCMDGGAVEGQWETVLALFHGGPDVFRKYFHLAKDQLILAAHGTLEGNFGPDGHKVRKCFDVTGVKQRLDSEGVNYTLRPVTLEHGQPLADMGEARAFARTYSAPMDDGQLDAYLAGKLQATQDGRFPYYLPNKKHFGLFIIRRDENENL